MIMKGIVNLANLLVWCSTLSPVDALPNKGDIKVRVDVPAEAEVGSTLDLRCEWALTDGNTLYSVKWYKDDHEFFRYVPGNQQRIHTFPQPGVYLDERANTANSIRLTELTLRTSGQYKCEVSTEAPSFATTYLASNLTVIDLPEKPPDITGLSSQYAIGEDVTANCTSWPSQPPAKISWSINGMAVSPEHTISYVRRQFPNSVEDSRRTTLGIRFVAASPFFDPEEGHAVLECIAMVGSRRYATERLLSMTHINNQPLSAGENSAKGLASSASIVRKTFLVLVALASTTIDHFKT